MGGRGQSCPLTHTSIMMVLNNAQVGGERVKEMDHFVASVETPTVTVQLPDVAPMVAAMAAEGRQPVPIHVPADGQLLRTAADFELSVQPQFRQPDGSVSPLVRGLAVAFYRLLHTVVVRLLQRDMADVVIYYQVTMRADVCICSRSKEDGRLYCNLMAFHQQQACDAETGELQHSRRLWRYWTQRVAMALAGIGEQGKPGGRAGDRIHPTPEQLAVASPTGLYDPAIRRRFRDFMAELGLD